MSKTKTKKPAIPKRPTINFASAAARQTWQDFGERNVSSTGHCVQNYARTLMLLMQGYLEEKPNSDVMYAANFAIAEAAINDLTIEQRTLAHALIAKCWIHGKQFASAVNA